MTAVAQVQSDVQKPLRKIKSSKKKHYRKNPFPRKLLRNVIVPADGELETAWHYLIGKPLPANVIWFLEEFGKFYTRYRNPNEPFNQNPSVIFTRDQALKYAWCRQSGRSISRYFNLAECCGLVERRHLTVMEKKVLPPGKYPPLMIKPLYEKKSIEEGSLPPELNGGASPSEDSPPILKEKGPYEQTEEQIALAIQTLALIEKGELIEKDEYAWLQVVFYLGMSLSACKELRGRLFPQLAPSAFENAIQKYLKNQKKVKESKGGYLLILLRKALSFQWNDFTNEVIFEVRKKEQQQQKEQKEKLQLEAEVARQKKEESSKKEKQETAHHEKKIQSLESRLDQQKTEQKTVQEEQTRLLNEKQAQAGELSDLARARSSAILLKLRSD